MMQPTFCAQAVSNPDAFCREAMSILCAGKHQKALTNPQYRKGAYQQWLLNDDGKRVQQLQAMNLTANNTQKVCAMRGDLACMIRLSTIQELCNMLLVHQSFVSTYQESCASFNVQQTVKGINFHVIRAIRKYTFFGTDLIYNPQSGQWNVNELSPVNVADGLQITCTPTQLEFITPQYNCMASDPEVSLYFQDMYSETEEGLLQKKKTGFLFRGCQLASYDHHSTSPKKHGASGVQHTTIWTEMLDPRLIYNGDRPIFFAPRKGCSFQPEDRISFEQGNIRDQIIGALPSIAQAILQFPQGVACQYKPLE